MINDVPQTASRRHRVGKASLARAKFTRGRSKYTLAIVMEEENLDKAKVRPTNVVGVLLDIEYVFLLINRLQ